MNCLNCHKDIPEESKFCRFCGKKVTEKHEILHPEKKEKGIEEKSDISHPQEVISSYQYGSFIKRIIAFIIDGVIAFILWINVYILLYFLNINTVGWEIFILFGTYIIYNSIFIWKSGSTLGKRLLRLRVIDASHENIIFIQAVIRESVGKFISFIIIGLGFSTALIDKHSQTWHDKLAKTYVLALTSKGQFITTSHKPVSKKRKVAFFLSILVIISLLFLYLFVVQTHEIKGSSMEPSYRNGEYVLTDKISYRFKELVGGDVIIFKAPKNPELDYFSRIIGIPGDKIELKEGLVYVNGKLLSESYLAPNTSTLSDFFLKENQPVTIPSNQYFVLGDNRTHSSDSREWGVVPKANIVGKVIYCYWNCPSTK